MKKFILLALMTLLFSLSAFAGNLTLLKRTITVTPKRFMRYWKNPKAAEPVYDTYSWVPEIRFDVLGPLDGGSKIYVEFDKPDGKLWLKYNMRTPELQDDYMDTIKMDSIDDSEWEKMAITDPGVIPFRIKMKNALAGTDIVLFAGKLKVGTYLLDQKIPEFKSKKDFFIDYDWQMVGAYLWLDPRSDENVPQVAAQICIKGNITSATLESYLFYNGKQIAKNSPREVQRMSSAADEPSHRWGIYEAVFSTVRGFNKNQFNSYAGQHYLDKNPGEYEIRVMRDNNLARSIKFTVGADGKIADNGVAKKAALGGVRMIVPVKIIGTADGQYNAAAWQTDSLFGNPWPGFTPAQ